MGLSDIALQQREKEEEALKTFIVFSLIGSAVLHIAVLFLTSLWVGTSVAEEPIEVIVVDSPNLEAEKPKEKIQPKPKAPAKSGGGGSGGGSNAGGGSGGGGFEGGRTPATSLASSQPRNSQSEIALSPLPITAQKQFTLVESSARRTSVPIFSPPKVAESPTSEPTPTLTPTPFTGLPTEPESPTPEPAPTPTPTPFAGLPTEPESPTPEPTPTPTPSPNPSATTKPQQTSQPIPTTVTPSPQNLVPATPRPPRSPLQQASERLRELFGGRTNPRENQEIANNTSQSGNTDRAGSSEASAPRSSENRGGSGSGTGSGSGNGSGTGSGSGQGTGSGNGNGPGTGSGSNVATGPRKPIERRGNRNRPAKDSGSGSIACRRCPEPTYPPGAGDIEGSAKVIIEVDKDGNVRDVQLRRTSGYDILDRTALETVREKWKFTKSENGGRVRAELNFAQSGSDFQRQARERERRARQAQERREQRERELRAQRERELRERELQAQREREQQELREQREQELQEQREAEELNRNPITPKPTETTPEPTPSPSESISPPSEPELLPPESASPSPEPKESDY